MRETWKAIDLQRDSLAELRARIGGALTLSTVAFALLKGELLADDELRFWGRPAAVGIGILFITVFVSSWPRKWRWIRDPGAMSQIWNRGKTFDEMLVVLFEDGLVAFHFNGKKLKIVEVAHSVAVAVLGLVFVSMALALIPAANGVTVQLAP